MARILSVWRPRWPITVWRRTRGGCVSAETPAALVIAERGVRQLHCVNSAAAGLGLFEGQKAAPALDYAPLPTNIAKQLELRLATLGSGK